VRWNRVTRVTDVGEIAARVDAAPRRDADLDLHESWIWWLTRLTSIWLACGGSHALSGR
jgi:hypothetical protein